MLLILLNMLAEGTVAALHVGEFILILNEEATAVLAHVDGHIGHHILEVPPGHVGAEVCHVLHEDLLEAHALHHILTHLDRLVVLRCSVLRVKQSLSKQVIFDAFVGIIHRKHLLLLSHILTPATTTAAASSGWRILTQKLLHTLRRNAWVWLELNKRK